jgi:Protein of unknown function (DUF1353)
VSSSFTAPLEVRKLQGSDLWCTLRAMDYWTDCVDGEQSLEIRCRTCITVPAGFETDFASIPRLFWSSIGHPAGEYAQAAVLHDWLYRSQLVPRARADALFSEAMKVLGVPGWRRWLMWAAVRVGGAGAYAAGEP